MRQNAENVSSISTEGRNHYVIKHITDSFLELLKTQSLNDISISELCIHAGVGRASFYRNFQSKEDILKKHLNELFHEWDDIFKETNQSPFNQKINVLFSHFQKNRNFYEVLYASGLIYLLKDAIINIYGSTSDCTAQEAYSKAFVTYSLYGWVDVWFQRGMKESPEELENLFKNV